MSLKNLEKPGEMEEILKSSKWIYNPQHKETYTDKYLSYTHKKYSDERLVLSSVSYFRKIFIIEDLNNPVELLITALGCYSVKVNSEKISDYKLLPGFTQYDKTVYAQKFDISKYIKNGKNEIVISLSNGWYAGYVGYGLKAKIPGKFGNNGRQYWGGVPKIKACIKSNNYKIKTDSTWECSFGPIIESDILMGERHDTRITDYSWNSVGVEMDDVSPKVSLQVHPPIRPVRYIDSVNLGGGVFDMGENIAGVVEISVIGVENDEVIVHHSEILSNGELDVKNLRCARAVDSYILSGGHQTLIPEFTYHGFRYVHIESSAHILKVRGVIFTTDLNYHNITFENLEADKLMQNIIRTQQANFMDIPTDCPQRDERLGWGGDIHIYTPTAIKISNCKTFLLKWLKDLNDSQWETGEYPVYAPKPYAREFERGAAGWSDAGIIVPYLLYVEYCSSEIWDFYPNMLKYMEWRFQRDPIMVGKADLGKYGDWLGIVETPSDLIDLCYHHYDCEIMSKLCGEYGDKKLSLMFYNRARDIRCNFKNKFVKDDQIINGTQTAYILAIKFCLIDAKFVKKLVELINNEGGLTTGFLGSAYILDVLSDNGHHELALNLFYGDNSKWLTPVRKGSTTVWERWDSDTSKESMNSYSHFAFGAIGEWMCKWLNPIIHIK